MILEYARYYPNITAFRDLQGSNCFLCKAPYICADQLDPVGGAIRSDLLKCNVCDWSLSFILDANQCIRPYIWRYKSFQFCLFNNDFRNPPKLWYGDLKNWIQLRTTRVDSISLRACLDIIRSGEVKRAQLKLRKQYAHDYPAN